MRWLCGSSVSRYVRQMPQQRPPWEVYERMIARLIADQVGTDLCVTPNAWITGKITGIRRQIDVLIDARHDTDNTRRIIVDAKRKRRKVDVKDVEALLGVMKDVEATHGYLISPAGHTKAAERRAQMSVSIRIVPIDRLESFDPATWPQCRRCKPGRVFWDGYPEFSLLLASTEPGEQKLMTVRFIHYVGKCDRCGLFHVWCTDCDDVLAVPEDNENDYGHQCQCKPQWFWLASIEEDERGRRSAELHVTIAKPSGIEIITVDRRAL
jgi:hypothetical protein